VSALALPKLDLGTVGVGLGLGAIAVITAYFVLKNAGALGAFAGKAAGDVAAGAVLGVSDSLGIPRTDEDKCTAAIAAGRSWDASLYCPAGRFLRSIFADDPAPVPINPRDRS
jgi:hypothetical protein